MYAPETPRRDRDKKKKRDKNPNQALSRFPQSVLSPLPPIHILIDCHTGTGEMGGGGGVDQFL